MSKVKELGSSSFSEFVDTDELAVVEFYLPECPHCQQVAPIYDEVSEEMGDKARFAKVNLRNNKGLGAKFGISGTPTFKFFCRRRNIGEHVGFINETILRNTIKDFLIHRRECIKGSTPVDYEMDIYR